MTGLEPATSGVTGRRSNQLSYIRISCDPHRCEAREIVRTRLRCQPIFAAYSSSPYQAVRTQGAARAGR